MVRSGERIVKNDYQLFFKFLWLRFKILIIIIVSMIIIGSVELGGFISIYIFDKRDNLSLLIYSFIAFLILMTVSYLVLVYEYSPKILKIETNGSIQELMKSIIGMNNSIVIEERADTSIFTKIISKFDYPKVEELVLTGNELRILSEAYSNYQPSINYYEDGANGVTIKGPYIILRQIIDVIVDEFKEAEFAKTGKINIITND